MRAPIVWFTLLLCLTSGAKAQVSVDMRALDSLGSAQPPPRPPPARPPAAVPAPVSHAAAKPTVAPPASPTVAAHGHATAAPGPAPIAPTVSTAPALPTVQPSAAPAAAMAPAPTPGPLPLPPPVRVVFEEGKADLTPADEDAIRGLARSIPAPTADSVNVVAYAAGKPDDPSTARRLSLSRGLAVRSVLLATGVPSAQIYVRALGATASDGPVDRVELTVAPLGTVKK